ncbi:periplasmic binding protein/LacI transcriptional regulator [Pseudodesulfovibrio mercurii]|uniref:Periplasmic binding protein/LacI transcriptional regulator n=1 Tax=Pseudodesulfovibrio mercurii TaxID=641491 RepID=F0JJK3_9BACT|nr:TMAO reductase system periplasmic protein TorT [Pseudodesulfovibrio mercurii]EGB16102.1 periplasmic binding protein/LacI transcriptional regulator [Pseudodesulfovibrio mercurii]
MTRRIPRRAAVLAAGALALALCLAAVPAPGADDVPWWPIQVKSWYGIYDPGGKQPGRAAVSLDRPRLEEWTPPRPPSGRYTVGVCVPHLKDPYWVAVNYGVIEEARRLGLGVDMTMAGGYGGGDVQADHLRGHLRDGVDGVILAAVDYAGNDQVIAELREAGVPVVEMITDVLAPAVSAKALVSYHEVGGLVGEYVAGHAERAGLDTVRIVFFPGPRNAGWAPETLAGFMEAMDSYPGSVDLADVAWGDTGREEQAGLLRRVLAAHPDVDYVVGNAVAAEAAPDILRELGLADRVSVVSSYIMPSLYRRIRSGEVLAAAADLNVYQGRMAVDMMARIFNGEVPGRDFPFRSGPFIPMITVDNIGDHLFKGLFGPRDYLPVFHLEPGE